MLNVGSNKKYKKFINSKLPNRHELYKRSDYVLQKLPKTGLYQKDFGLGPYLLNLLLWGLNLVRGGGPQFLNKNLTLFQPGRNIGRKTMPTTVLKYGSRKKISFCSRCSSFLSPTFVEIKNSFTRTLLTFNSKNFGIICYWKNTDQNKRIICFIAL